MPAPANPFADVKKDVSRRMEQAVEALKRELAGLRAGRAHASLLAPVTVEAYGQSVPLSQIGAVNAPDPRALTVSVWDKSMVKPAEKAVRDAGLGLNPVADGQVIRIPIPPLTNERRQQLTKIAAKYSETARVSVRNVRRDGNDALKKMEKDGLISRDEQHRHQSAIQKITDEAIRVIDEHLDHKQKEIMRV